VGRKTLTPSVNQSHVVIQVQPSHAVDNWALQFFYNTWPSLSSWYN